VGAIIAAAGDEAGWIIVNAIRLAGTAAVAQQAATAAQ